LKNLKVWLALLAVLAIVGCNGQWSGNGGSGGGQGRNKPHATEEETRQAFEKLMGAIANKDTETINGMMTSNATFIDPPVGPGVFTWSEAKPILENAFAHSEPFQLSNDPSYRVGVNRDLGWIATVFHVRTQSGNSINKSDGAVSVLFQKTEGGYKVLIFHAARFLVPPTVTPIPAGKAPEAKKPAGTTK
jgi:ketosteroid isomerase-like protein